MISAAQIRLLHTAKSILRLDDESYRALLQAEAGVTSSRDLDDAGLDRVLRRFSKLGFRNTAHRPRRRQTGGVVTPQQLDTITRNYELLEQASAAAGNPGFASMQARMAFNRRQCGKQFPQTIADAIKVIEGQKAYLRRLTDAVK